MRASDVVWDFEGEVKSGICCELSHPEHCKEAEGARIQTVVSQQQEFESILQGKPVGEGDSSERYT